MSSSVNSSVTAFTGLVSAIGATAVDGTGRDVSTGVTDVAATETGAAADGTKGTAADWDGGTYADAEVG